MGDDEFNPVDKAKDEFQLKLDKKSVFEKVDKSETLELLILRKKVEIKEIWNPSMESCSYEGKSILKSIVEVSLESDVPYQDIADWIYGDAVVKVDDYLKDLYHYLRSREGKDFIQTLDILVTEKDRYEIKIFANKAREYVLEWTHYHKIRTGKWMRDNFSKDPNVKKGFENADEAHKYVYLLMEDLRAR